MRSRAVRLTLMLLAVAALGAAAYFYVTTQSQITRIAQRAEAFESSRLAAMRQTFELRAAQQAYVAAGQNEAFWFDKATSSAEALKAALAATRSATDSAPAHTALDEAAAALKEFEDRDRRVRSYTSSGQRLLASDVIFSDGLEATSRIGSAIDQAAAASALSEEASLAAGVRRQQLAMAAAAGFLLLGILLLVPIPPGSTTTTDVAGDEPVAGPAAGLDLRPSPRIDVPIKPMPVAPEPVRVERTTAAPPVVPVAMESLASVCTDLARLADTGAMPALLERTAAALDASGLVVWVADQDLKSLMPLAAHGYAASVLSRMGSLPVDSENATSAAFRTGQVQTVSAAGSSPGAIAAPLLSASGCLGVMSVEIRGEGEKHPARLAAAAIIAAQLATLVAPPVAEAPLAEAPLTQAPERSAAL
jgi:hypothetical protein